MPYYERMGQVRHGVVDNQVCRKTNHIVICTGPICGPNHVHISNDGSSSFSPDVVPSNLLAYQELV